MQKKYELLKEGKCVLIPLNGTFIPYSYFKGTVKVRSSPIKKDNYYIVGTELYDDITAPVHLLLDIEDVEELLDVMEEEVKE